MIRPAVGDRRIRSGTEAAMARRRRTGLWITGALGVAGIVGVTEWVLNQPGRRAEVSPPSAPARRSLAERVGRGEAQALAALSQQVTTAGTPTGLDEVEGARWIEALGGLRAGFSKFGGSDRAASVAVV